MRLKKLPSLSREKRGKIKMELINLQEILKRLDYFKKHPLIKTVKTIPETAKQLEKAFNIDFYTTETHAYLKSEEDGEETIYCLNEEQFKEFVLTLKQFVLREAVLNIFSYQTEFWWLK